MTKDTRLARQIQFLLEIDQLKAVLRRSLVTAERRRENSAEHSWHVAMAALILREHANQPINLERVLKMLLIHDIVEIDAGDTFVYDANGQQDRIQREREAARRIFGLLPPDQEQECRELWEEFEARETPDARFAAALDRLQAVLQNHHTGGLSWRRNGVNGQQVIQYNRYIADGSHKLWELVQQIVDSAIKDGNLAP